MDFLFWCKDPHLCTCFDENKNFKNMSYTTRLPIVDGEYPIPGRAERWYGGIHILSWHRMLAVGINPDYLEKSCKRNTILIVAIENTGNNDEDIYNKKILGIVTLKLHSDKVMEIDVIGVRTHHANIGTILLKLVCDSAKKCEYNICFLKSVPSAMRFYLKSGFTYLGTTKLDPIFALDLTTYNDFNTRPRLQRQNTGNNYFYDRYTVQEVESQFIEQEDELARNRGIKRYIKLNEIVNDWNTLKTGQRCEWMYERRVPTRSRQGYYIPHIKLTSPFVEGKSPKASMPLATINAAAFKSVPLHNTTRIRSGRTMPRNMPAAVPGQTFTFVQPKGTRRVYPTL
jgi:hypothetical protein